MTPGSSLFCAKFSCDGGARIVIHGKERKPDEVGSAPFKLSRPYGKIFFEGPLWDGAKANAPEMKTLKLSDAALNDLNVYLVTDDPMPTYLDVLGEDDTDFDYTALWVWYY